MSSLLNLQHKYQYRLTRYLLRFRTLVKIPTIVLQEFQLKNVLINARFLLSEDFTINFIATQNVFVNGILCANPLFQLQKGDFIQLVINLKYYIMFKTLFIHATNKRFKIRNYFRQQASDPLRETNPNISKDVSRRIPAWFSFHKY